MFVFVVTLVVVALVGCGPSDEQVRAMNAKA